MTDRTICDRCGEYADECRCDPDDPTDRLAEKIVRSILADAWLKIEVENVPEACIADLSNSAAALLRPIMEAAEMRLTGGHAFNCRKILGGVHDPCTCGYDALAAALRGERESDD